ncbi:hypothetical protein [Crocosphaera chwakensis]|uniref:Uncharacterized protein n=1 Tax=Crocosphaera chwakensis CCY0110 TaxID=391612 RepID=A3IZQ7_9CHRO|nr:hypothetical protein [Crocosphaera chwakensis]EAZ88036.1 hypothetical protein CY0110_25793 [Crocosphaera chwakensis CCY0110]
MAKASEQPLQPNPFRTYRDPKTGLWVVIPVTKTTNHFSSSVGQEISSDSKDTL